MITRRRFLSAAIPAVVAVRCSQSRSGSDNGSPKSTAQGTGPPVLSSAPRLKLVAANFRNLCSISFRVARERGFFSAAGLDVDLLPADVSGGHQHTAAWVAAPSGSARADITVVEYPALADIAADKLDYYVVAGEHSGCKQLIVPANSRIQSLADLKGKRIGLPPFSDQLMWEYLTRQVGVGPNPFTGCR